MRGRRTPGRVVAATVVAVLGTVLTGCGGLGGTSNKSTAIGDGTVSTVAAGDRQEPVAFTGTTLDGEAVDVADYRGKVVVLNIWGSWCAPCRDEMPRLLKAHELLGDEAVFLGIDVRETSKANALAFERTFEVPWSSVDDQGGHTLLALRGVVPPTATPSTLVLDPLGRVAARVLGPVPTAITLKDLVEDAAA